MPKKKKVSKSAKKGLDVTKKQKAAAKKEMEENVVATAEAASKLWEIKLNVTEKSRLQYRENAKLLTLENERIQKQMMHTERDTIDVIAYLKDQDQKKITQIEDLQEEVKNLKITHREEKETVAEDFSRQINELEDTLLRKTKEVEKLDNELKSVKEFRRKRGQMQRELDEIKEAMYVANKEHKEQLANMEQKFMSEKVQLQKEADQKIEMLAERAHKEALANLDETTRTVYKHNLQLSKALEQHVKEMAELNKRKAELEDLNRMYKHERDENEGIVRVKMTRDLKNKKLIKQLREKVGILEDALTHMAREFGDEKLQIVARTGTETEAARIEIGKLQRVLELKTAETNRIKHLARNILTQRTDVERFFLEALDHVRAQISANQKQYRCDAKIAYTKKMLDATRGKTDFPKIRTFHKSTSSTNNVFTDVEVAGNIHEPNLHVDISELTWEQKERILRYLFALMNGCKPPTIMKPAPLPPIMAKEEILPVMDEIDQTFITNQRVESEYQMTATQMTESQTAEPHMTESRMTESQLIAKAVPPISNSLSSSSMTTTTYA